MQLLAQGLRDQHAPGFVESELGGHIGDRKWENPLAEPIS
jgi:hypothetical protein